MKTIPSWLAAGVVGIVAAAIRVLFVLQTTPFPTLDPLQPGADADLYWRAAEMIRRGPGPGPHFEGIALSAPFFPYWLALQQAILGDSLMVHRLFGALLGGCSIFTFCVVASRVGSTGSGALVGLLLSWLPSLVLMDTHVTKTALEIFGLVATIGIALSLSRDAPGTFSARKIVALGMILSALFLSQLMTVLFVLPVLAFLGTSHARRQGPGRAWWVVSLAVGTPVLLTIAAWSSSGPSRPDSWFQARAGVDVRVGFNERATGYYQPLPEIEPTMLGHLFDGRLEAEAAVGHPLSAREASRYHLMKAAEFIEQQPIASLKLVGRKVLLFFNRFEARTEDFVEPIRQRVPSLRWSPVNFGWFVVLGGCGALALWRRKELPLLLLLAGLITAVLLPTLAGHVNWRFRLPAVIPLALLTVIALDEVRAGVSAPDPRGTTSDNRSRLALVAILSPILPLRLLVTHPVLDDHEVARLESAWEAGAQLADRLAHLNERTPQPDGVVSKVHKLVLLQRHTEAFRALPGIVPASSDDSWANRQYVIYLLWAGRYGDVAGFLAMLAAHDPLAYRLTLENLPANTQRVIAITRGEANRTS